MNPEQARPYFLKRKGADPTRGHTNRTGIEDKSGRRALPAGRFSSWLRRLRGALAAGKGITVPCGACHACCRSSYFIHIRPEETRTLARIPKKLLSPAPGLPRGHVLLGHYADGRCPMLKDGRCSIYEYRPLTCRNFDCRIFAAAGILAGGGDKSGMNRRIRRWKFDYAARRDRNQHSAVRAAAGFLREKSGCLPAETAPGNPTQLAVLAVKIYGVFLKPRGVGGRAGRISRDSATVKAVMRANEKFGSGRLRPCRPETRLAAAPSRPTPHRCIPNTSGAGKFPGRIAGVREKS